MMPKCAVDLLAAVVAAALAVACGTPRPAAETATETAAETAADGGDFEVLSPALAAAASALRTRALEDRRAFELVASLTTEVGPRLAGSEGDRRAVAWGRATLEAWGFANVRSEPVTVPRWQRGDAAGEVVAPFPQPVVLAALGGSVGTPEGGLEAELLAVADLDALAALDGGAAGGKIVFVSQRMRRTADGAGYGEAVRKRVAGASLAAEKGALALLIRSAGTSSSRIAHTGTMRYREQAPRIPAAALSNADADLLERQLAHGQPVRFRLELGCRHLGEAPSANVIGEVVGSELPEEVVLLVGHLDSWDLGTGAHDDGAGIAIVTAAAKLIAEQPLPPRRTVRVWYAANEEFGLSGARAYAARYQDQLARHVVGMEADLGAGPVRAWLSGVDPGRLAVMRDLGRLLQPLGIPYQGNEARGGADLGPLRPARVPLIDLRQDASLYFDVHHTIDDTLDKIVPEHLRQNVAAYATAAYVAAMVDGDLGRAPEPAAPPGTARR